MSALSVDSPEALPISPEEVLLAALRALDAHDHARVTALTDTASVRERFEGYCEVSQPRTFEWFAKHVTIPPEQLNESYERFVQSGGAGERMNQFRGLGVSSHAELIALGPEEYFTRSMAAEDHTWNLAQRLRKHGRVVPPELLATLPGMEYEVLGGVHETPDLVHLLFRYVMHRGKAEEHRGPVTRVAVRRQPDGTWRLLAEGSHFLDTAWPQRVMIVDEKYADLFDEIHEEHAREFEGPPSPPE